MKKNIIALSLVAMSMVACDDKKTEVQPQEVTPTENEDNATDKEAPKIVLVNEQKPVLFKYTSTGCPGCGSWGAPTFERISSEQKEALVPIAVHIKYGDPMITDISNAIAQNRTGQYYTPQLWVNNENGMVLNGGRIDGNGSITKMNTEIANKVSTTPEVQVGVSSVVNDTKLTVKYATRTNENIAGEYSVAVYLMENKISYRQSGGATNPFEHNYVIRSSNNGAWGQALTAADLVENAQTEKVINLEIDPEWNKENLYATVVVWKKTGDTYTVINANNNFIH